MISQLCIIALSLTPAKSQSLKRFRKDQLLSFVKNEIVPDVISHVPKRIVLVNKNNHLLISDK